MRNALRPACDLFNSPRKYTARPGEHTVPTTTWHREQGGDKKSSRGRRGMKTEGRRLGRNGEPKTRWETRFRVCN